MTESCCVPSSTLVLHKGNQLIGQQWLAKIKSLYFITLGADHFRPQSSFSIG